MVLVQLLFGEVKDTQGNPSGVCVPPLGVGGPTHTESSTQLVRATGLSHPPLSPQLTVPREAVY